MLTQVPPLEVLPWYALVDLWGCFTRVSRQPFYCVFHSPLNKLRRLFIHSIRYRHLPYYHPFWNRRIYIFIDLSARVWNPQKHHFIHQTVLEFSVRRCCTYVMINSVYWYVRWGV
eukprot:COSAG02_NODE_430_length_22462_cov_52.755042_18_plen_115_part_00